MQTGKISASCYSLTLRSRLALVTTVMLERAIAASAIIGFRRPAMATGIAITLYANAQKIVLFLFF